MREQCDRSYKQCDLKGRRRRRQPRTKWRKAEKKKEVLSGSHGGVWKMTGWHPVDVELRFVSFRFVVVVV